MRVIEKKVGEAVSPEMLQEAKNLRNLASLVEGGNAVAVAYAWVAKEGNSVNLDTNHTWCADAGSMSMLGVVSLMQTRLAIAIDNARG